MCSLGNSSRKEVRKQNYVGCGGMFRVVNKHFFHCEEPGFGVCVKTTRIFKPGDVVYRLFPSLILTDPALHSVQVAPSTHVYDKWFAGRITHSCDPNMSFDQSSLIFYAVKNIKAGEILTQDYDMTEDKLYRPFICKCGCINCRGYIAGKNATRVSKSKER